MGRGKRQSRIGFVTIMMVIVMMWISGCSESQSLNISTAGAGGKPFDETVFNEGKGPQAGSGSNGKQEVIVGKHEGEGGEFVHVDLEGKPPKDKPDPVVEDDLAKPDPHVIEEQPIKNEKIIALTFDDGPDKRYTTDILDILKRKGVKATFFVVGQQVTKNPEVLQRIVDEGHAIGNHTYNHKDLSKLTKQQIIEEVKTGDAAIKKAVGFTPVMFRAPYGAVSDILKDVLKANNRELVGWNIDTRDWAGTSASDIRKMIKEEAKPNGIILMHSFGSKHIKNTVQALPGVIDDLKEMGYTLVFADQFA